MHAEHLEATFGVGPHTQSAYRAFVRQMSSTEDFPDAISDEMFCPLWRLPTLRCLIRNDYFHP